MSEENLAAEYDRARGYDKPAAERLAYLKAWSQGNVPHDHGMPVPGCFRCDLSRDES